MSDAAVTDSKLPPAKGTDGRFLPGNNGGGGRPFGARNKLSEAFLSALATDFERHGADVIERVRQDKPDAYLKVVASIMPQKFEVESDGVIQVVTKAQRDVAVSAAQRADR